MPMCHVHFLDDLLSFYHGSLAWPLHTRSHFIPVPMSFIHLTMRTAREAFTSKYNWRSIAGATQALVLKQEELRRLQS